MSTPTTIGRLRERPRAPRRRGPDRVILSVRGIDAWHAARQRDEDGVALLTDAERRQHEAIVIATSHQLQQAGGPLDHPMRRTVVVVAPPGQADTLASAATRAGLAVVALCWDAASAIGFTVAEQPDLVLVAGEPAGDFTREAARDLARFSPATNVVVVNAGCEVDAPPPHRVHVVPGAPPASLVARWLADTGAS